MDFRRKHGLPAAPTNVVEMPSFSWQDEEFVRFLPNEANEQADINVFYLYQYQWLCNAVGEVCSGGTCKIGSPAYEGSWPYVCPGIAAAYLTVQTPGTGRKIILDILAGSDRSRQAALMESQKQALDRMAEQKRLEDARLLLKDEFDRLKEEIKASGRVIATLRDALRPFAELWEDTSDNTEANDNNEVSLWVSLDEIKNAQDVVD